MPDKYFIPDLTKFSAQKEPPRLKPKINPDRIRKQLNFSSFEPLDLVKHQRDLFFTFYTDLADQIECIFGKSLPLFGEIVVKKLVHPVKKFCADQIGDVDRDNLDASLEILADPDFLHKQLQNETANYFDSQSSSKSSANTNQKLVIQCFEKICQIFITLLSPYKDLVKIIENLRSKIEQNLADKSRLGTENSRLKKDLKQIDTKLIKLMAENKNLMSEIGQKVGHQAPEKSSPPSFLFCFRKVVNFDKF